MNAKREMLIAMAQKWHAKSNSERMKLALIAAHVVGHYEVGATAELAARTHMSVSQIHNYARAGRLFAEMVAAIRREDRAGDVLDAETGVIMNAYSDKRAELYAALRLFRAELGITYWHTLSRLRDKYNSGNFTVGLVWSYMAEVIENDGTIDRLVTLVATEHGDAGREVELPEDDPAEFSFVDNRDAPKDASQDAPVKAERGRPIYSGRVVAVGSGPNGEVQITVNLTDSVDVGLGSSITFSVTSEHDEVPVVMR